MQGPPPKTIYLVAHKSRRDTWRQQEIQLNMSSKWSSEVRSLEEANWKCRKEFREEGTKLWDFLSHAEATWEHPLQKSQPPSRGVQGVHGGSWETKAKTPKETNLPTQGHIVCSWTAFILTRTDFAFPTCSGSANTNLSSPMSDLPLTKGSPLKHDQRTHHLSHQSEAVFGLWKIQMRYQLRCKNSARMSTMSQNVACTLFFF